jgi:hAT family C-terminal dimerisation region
MSQPTPEIDMDPLQYWQNNSKRYPVLHQIAMSILAIPPTSAMVERLFSEASILLSKRRSRLCAKK